jgi:hypothetical protein
MTYVRFILILTGTLSLLPATYAQGEPVSRTDDTRAVVDARWEDMSFLDEVSQEGACVRQTVHTSDEIRSNTTGQIALAFFDMTQIRLGRNSKLPVTEIRSRGGVTLNLKTSQPFRLRSPSTLQQQRRIEVPIGR